MANKKFPTESVACLVELIIPFFFKKKRNLRLVFRPYSIEDKDDTISDFCKSITSPIPIIMYSIHRLQELH